jgi:hypothetical protein
MKMSIEVECTPEEARRFLGLPDLSPLNDRLVEAVAERMEDNMNALRPDQFVKTWFETGAQAQDTFMRLMDASLRSAAPPAKK